MKYTRISNELSGLVLSALTSGLVSLVMGPDCETVDGRHVAYCICKENCLPMSQYLFTITSSVWLKDFC